MGYHADKYDTTEDSELMHKYADEIKTILDDVTDVWPKAWDKTVINNLRAALDEFVDFTGEA